MTLISVLLLAKIIVTAIAVTLPLLLLSPVTLGLVLGISSNSGAFFRLYGVATASLLVGYAFGISLANDGIFPWSAAVMGAISNSGSAILLLTRRAESPVFLPLGLFFAAIAIGLIFFVFNRHAALWRLC